MLTRELISRTLSVVLMSATALAGNAHAAPIAARIGAGIPAAQRNSAQPILLQLPNPRPLYSIAWTATGTSHSYVVNSIGEEDYWNRNVSLDGTATYRQYASGAWDYFPYNLNVSDDLLHWATTTCYPDPGFAVYRQTWTITDSSRYNTGPLALINGQILPPGKQSDGSWAMYLPNVALVNFTYQEEIQTALCDGSVTDNIVTEERNSFLAPFYGAFGKLKGDAQGNVFTKSAHFVSPDYWPPMTVYQTVAVKVLERHLTVTSTPTQDGWILESGENTNAGGTMNAGATTFNVGDDASNRQYRAILSFNTAALPDTASIQSVLLKIKQSGTPTGTNPFTVLGSLWVDIRKPYFGTTSSLQLIDFNAAASAAKVGSFGKTPSGGWYKVTLGATGRSKVNKAGLTQFRLYFSLDDNNNHLADFMKFFSGNALAASRPVLLITYTMP